MAAKLTKAEANDLRAADRAYWSSKAAADAAKERRAQLLEQHKAKLPAGEWVEAFGHLFRRSTRTTGERFSLKSFREAGYKVTAHMRRFVSAGHYDVLDIREV